MGASPLGDHPSALWTAAVHVHEREAVGMRGMTLGIFGGLGHHRYGVVGSGDTLEAWETLRWEIYETITAANVLTAWTHDLGGFYPESGEHGIPPQVSLLRELSQMTAGVPPGNDAWMHDPERYLRWLQWGAQSPFFRPHASHGVVVPWAYNDTAAWMEPLWRWRSALLPYTYSAAHAASGSGVLPVRGLYIDWPEEEEGEGLVLLL